MCARTRIPVTNLECVGNSTRGAESGGQGRLKRAQTHTLLEIPHTKNLHKRCIYLAKKNVTIMTRPLAKYNGDLLFFI
jgi:hypothetical protein